MWNRQWSSSLYISTEPASEEGAFSDEFHLRHDWTNFLRSKYFLGDPLSQAFSLVLVHMSGMCCYYCHLCQAR